MWSKTSVSKEWVRTEASEGKQRGILIPVLIDDVKIPLAFRLMQVADFRDWKGKLPHPGFDNLLKAAEGILGRPVQPSQRTNEVRFKLENAIIDGGTYLEVQPSQKTNEVRDEEPEKIAKQGNSIGMKFTLISAGEFYRGSEEYDEEKPVHKVRINNQFYLATYPVTLREWKVVMGYRPSYFKGDDLPVEQVSWDDVQEFIKKLNEKESTDKYRLPSEAEWEYACRAGTTTRYSFGDSESKLGDYAWYSDNSDGETHSVGQKKPNSWGLYDLHGNVWEWVQDGWHDSYDGAPIDGSAWGGDGAARVLRGGSWYGIAGDCRSADRNHGDPRNRNRSFGFRLLKER